MVLDKPLKGKFVNLRSVTEDDAEFILQIRNDQQISKYLPPLNITVEQQRAWIRKQREDNESYYFVIENKSQEVIGTISVYNMHEGVVETGRYCSVGQPYENIEASILLYDFVFDTLKIEADEVWVYEDNKEILSLDKKFGAKFYRIGKAEDGRMALFGCVTPNNYHKARVKVGAVIYGIDFCKTMDVEEG